ncbi:MAG: 3-dehydro-scyllo-inosose hydrolase [Bacillota bacterium]|jgi:creatinine amidohydrolase/Fe(II)-dependent formamide hydrolase-like protein
MSEWTIPPKGGHMDLPTGVYFQNMTNKEVEERLKKNDLIIIPVGSTENHGPQAPYGEDTFLVTRLAEQAALRTGCTVAQPIWYGSHPYQHLGMPGTIVIPEETLAAYLRAIFAGFWNTGFRKMIILNGHGQDYVIPLAIHQFGKKYQVPGVIVYLHWWNACRDQIKDKSLGGPFETPFIHADECETSFSMALFPELCRQEHAVDTEPTGFMPPGHIDKSGEVYGYPIKWYNHYGLVGMECICTPEGVIGRSTLADPAKARPGVQTTLDYIVELHDAIMTRFPAGVLPPVDKVTQRRAEEIDEVVKGPTNGGRHIYTIAYPC